MTIATEAKTSTWRRDDYECQTDANAFLTDVMGAPPEDLQWDTIHHLQGHTHCSGRPLVVIASRDESHHALVLTLEDWDTIRRSDGCTRADMLRECAIENHTRLLDVLATN